jgi:cytochrome oxidase Cu insertion factor (SCO1/SenC/PrrC family)
MRFLPTLLILVCWSIRCILRWPSPYTKKGERYVARFAGTKSLDFTLIDAHGQTVRLADYRGAKKVVLVFNRGLY